MQLITLTKEFEREQADQTCYAKPLWHLMRSGATTSAGRAKKRWGEVLGGRGSYGSGLTKNLRQPRLDIN